MDNISLQKKIIAAVVFLVIIIVLGAGYFYRQPISDFLKKFPWKPEVEDKKEVKSELSLPSGFPADIPLEKGAVLEQSYIQDYPENLKQLTIVFESKKTADENYGIYESFLKEKNWNIINAHKEGEIYNLYGRKDGQDINMVIVKNKEQAGASSISISVVLSGVAEIKNEIIY